ncbi:MAG: glycosyltransferase [Candidatus Ventricola sp.]
MSDLVSVIVPVYNVEGELPRCLDSILGQTYPNIEIVAVNDGSTDASGRILDRYAQEYASIRVIHKENGGVTSARLRGIAEAGGEWIGFVDSDDEIEPDMYERLLKNALTHDAQISHCGYQIVFLDGRVHFFYNTGTLEKQDRLTALRELLSGQRIEPSLGNKLFRRTLFAGLLSDGVMPTDIRINEDLLMNYYLFAAAERTVYEDWCPYHYMARQASATRSGLNSCRIYDPIRVRRIICEEAPAEIEEDAQRAYLNACINMCHELIAAGKEYRSDLWQVRRCIREERSALRLLSKKRRLMAELILNLPILYISLYVLYARFLKYNPFE